MLLNKLINCQKVTQQLIYQVFRGDILVETALLLRCLTPLTLRIVAWFYRNQMEMLRTILASEEMKVKEQNHASGKMDVTRSMKVKTTLKDPISFKDLYQEARKSCRNSYINMNKIKLLKMVHSIIKWMMNREVRALIRIRINRIEIHSRIMVDLNILLIYTIILIQIQ